MTAKVGTREHWWLPIAVRSMPGDVERLARLKKGTTPFVKNWKTTAVVPDTPPRDVYLPEIAKTLVSGQFEDAGKKYSLVGKDEVAQRLSSGAPVVAMFQSDKSTSGESLRLIPGVASITDAPDRVTLDPADIAHLVAGDSLIRLYFYNLISGNGIQRNPSSEIDL